MAGMSIAEMLNTDFESVRLEVGPDGYTRVLFEDEEWQKVNEYLKTQLDATYNDWAPVWNESVENLDTFRTVPIPIPDGGKSLYPAPIARIPATQIISSVYNAIMRSKPIFSIDAYLNATYNVPESGTSQPGVLQTTPATAEKSAHRFEQSYEFVARERIRLGPKLMRGIAGAVKGSPYWWKVVADPDQHTMLAPKSDGFTVDLADRYEETRLRGDIVKWHLVPFTNCMMPRDLMTDEDGIDKSPWFAERTAWVPEHVAKKYAVGDLFLVPDDACAADIAATTVNAQDEFRARAAQSTDKTTVSLPAQACDTWLVWFDRDVLYTDLKTNKKTLKKLNLLGDFARTSGKLMTCWLNPYAHQSRPYELLDQMDDGDCTVAQMKYPQTMFTYAAQSEIQSAHAAGNLLYWYDPNEQNVSDFFSKTRTINPGDHVPGIKDKDWGTAAAGEKHYSMVELMKLFLSMSQLDSHENDFTMGGRPPGRTPSSTVAQVYQHAEETKTAFVARISNKLGRLLRLDMETRRQYQPLGEVLPVWDAEAKMAVEVAFRFPVGDVLDNFRIALTAADEALSQEHDIQQLMMRKQMLMQDGEYVAKVVAAIVNLQSPLPETGVALFKKILERVQAMSREMMSLSVSDEENYDLTPEIEALVQQRNQALAQMQSAGPQSPQPPEKVVLSGKLTPEQTAAAAQQAGIPGGMNAQGQNQGAGSPPAGAPGQGSPANPTVGHAAQPGLPVHPPAPSGPPSGVVAGPQ